jgi:hypothetical protein
MPLHLPRGSATWLLHLYHGGLAGVTAGLHAVARHTGIPVVLVAAMALVISWRLARRGGRLALELGLALVVVLAATRFGWVHW